MERYQPDQYGRMMPDAHGQWVSLRAAEITALDAAQKSSADAQATVEALRAQLPAEMQGCTILFKECEKGHGRLVATNWRDHGCQMCEVEALQARVLELEQPVYVCQGCGRLGRDGWLPTSFTSDELRGSVQCPDCGCIDREKNTARELAAICTKAQSELAQRTAELEAANNGFAQVRKKTIERVARHGPIMGSRGEYRQGQLDVLESVRRIVQEELYGSHQITG